MLEEGSAEELAQLTYPFGRGVNISFGIEDVPQLHQKLLEADYPIHRPLTKRNISCWDHYYLSSRICSLGSRWLFFKI